MSLGSLGGIPFVLGFTSDRSNRYLSSSWVCVILGAKERWFLTLPQIDSRSNWVQTLRAKVMRFHR